MKPDVSERCDMACEILRATNDGDNISPNELYLLQEAINGNLTDKGYEMFADLHKRVKEGSYAKPWHCGVEHMTKDHEGYIYFKGQHCEHYSFRDYEEEKKALIELQKTCLLLEAKGHPINSITTVWRVEEYLNQQERGVALQVN